MNRKELGQTGVMIPELGLGTWEYTNGIEPLRRGIECGAAFVDTAEAYGNEPLVGQAIKGIRDRVFLATKVSPSHFNRSDVSKAADRSLQLLNTDYIDLYQLHRPNPDIPIEETMGALEDLVDAGKVRFIGVSNFSLGQLQKAQSAMRRYRITSNQVTYSLINRYIEVDRLLSFCQTGGVSVIAYSPLGHGLGNVAARDPGNVLGRVATASGKTPAQIALNWCISKNAVVAIPKASSLARVEENCQASGWRLTTEHTQMLEKHFRLRSRLEVGLRRAVGRVLRATGLR
jgi:diketogulonate reductase-like aldo/keto reductase